MSNFNREYHISFGEARVTRRISIINVCNREMLEQAAAHPRINRARIAFPCVRRHSLQTLTHVSANKGSGDLIRSGTVAHFP